MKILLFGKNGQLGRALQQSLSSLGEVIALDRQSPINGDFENLSGLSNTIRMIKPNIIVNAAAYTAVDKAESEQALAALINAEAPAILAKESALIDALLVHYSTDYVFDGSGVTRWEETDKPNPINFYGKTKLQGEEAIMTAGCHYLIFRTSWVYSAHGNNFVKTILRLSQEKDTLNIVHDQIGAPTSAELLANVTVQVLRTMSTSKPCGLYHLSPSGETSWFTFAEYILNEAKKMKNRFKLQHLNPITSQAYQTPAPRPLNSRLNTQKISRDFSIELEPWQLGVAKVVKEILGTSS